MTALENIRSRKSTTPLLAIGEWLMILPASIFLLAGALRQMQPAQFEPAHTSWVIFNWAASHVTHMDAAVIFLALPAVVLLVGCVALLRAWGGNQTLRRDVTESFAILRRNFALCLIVAATLLGGTILAAVIAHLVIG